MTIVSKLLFVDNKPQLPYVPVNGIVWGCFNHYNRVYFSTDHFSTVGTFSTGTLVNASYVNISDDAQIISTLMTIRNSSARACGLYVSNDFGATWVGKVVYRTIDWVAGYDISHNGKYHYMGNFDDGSDYIFRSIDYGTTWNEISASGLFQMYPSCSGNGQYLLCMTDANRGINKYKVSSNYGSSYSSYTSPVQFVSFELNNDGSYMFARQNTATASIYISTDYGVSWTSKNLNTGGNAYVASSSEVTRCSYDGQYVYASLVITIGGVNYRRICRSENYGQSFILLPAPDAVVTSWYPYAWDISIDGQQVFIGHHLTSVIMHSTDYGMTYSPIVIADSIRSLRVSQNLT